MDAGSGLYKLSNHLTHLRASVLLATPILHGVKVFMAFDVPNISVVLDLDTQFLLVIV